MFYKNALVFKVFVEHILVSVLHSNNVVILDTKFIIMRRIETSWSNLFTIHLNLILLKWSKAKSYLKKIPIFDTEHLYRIITDALETITPSDARNCFVHCL